MAIGERVDELATMRAIQKAAETLRQDAWLRAAVARVEGGDRRAA